LRHHPKKGTHNDFHHFDRARLQDADRDHSCAGRAWHGGSGLYGEQQQMCTGDAMRLCASEIPDVERITACMVQKRAQLSDGCKAVFQYVPPTSTPANYAPAAKPFQAAQPDPAQARLSIFLIKVTAPCPGIPDVALVRFGRP
jgi:hypothetical protein